MRLKDYTGNKFGKIEVIKRAPNRKGETMWACVCECGTKLLVSSIDFRRGKTNCGCESPRQRHLEGQRFGNLVVIGIHERGAYHKNIKWKCKCDCGGEKIVETSSLTRGITKDCGCRARNRLVGKKFGRLTVLEPSYRNGKNASIKGWKCICECGNITYVDTNNLVAKKSFTASCGCMRKEKATKHNLSGTKIYKALTAIKGRCNNPKDAEYKNYGGRGIGLCEEWSREDGFKNFYDWSIKNGYDEGLTIDRIDNNKGYSPDNCRWTTRKVQQNNRRANRYITIGNETHSLTEWCDIKGIKASTVRDRLKRGWSEYDSIITPIGKKRAQ